MLYVAFTRAVERLHILANKSPGNTARTVNEWLEKFTSGFLKTKGDSFYESGTPAKKVSTEKEKSVSIFALEALRFNASDNLVKIKPSYLNNSDETENAKQQGILIHWLLSKIKTPEDIEKAIELACIQGLLNKDEIPELKIKLQTIVAHPQLGPFFTSGSNCRIESEIITSAGELLRPDRIVFEKEQTLLIDYKTGQRNDKKYLKQLAGYEDALISMGYSNIKKLILYIDEIELVEVN
jgi:ATP-dependent exoDNAse (exonuclease V) beta subunit